MSRASQAASPPFARRFHPGEPGALTRAGHAALARAADLGWQAKGCCLTFHRAVSAAAWPQQPNLGFHIDIAYLEHLLRHLRNTGWDVVTLDEALRRVRERDNRRFVNVSIDDCYRDTAELIVPLFRKLRMPVTLFVTTGIPDASLRLRDAGLETILGREEAVVDAETRYILGSAAERRAAFAAISARWDRLAEPDVAYLEFCRRHGYEAEVLDREHRLSWETLRALAADPLVEIGGHTVQHRRISALSDDAARAEIVGCRERLEAELSRTVRHFAFPYGRAGDCGARDFALVAESGFASAATTRKGLIGPQVDPFQLPRNTLNGTHRWLPYAYAHLTGASGLLAGWLRRG